MNSSKRKFYLECGLTRQVISRMYHFFWDIELDEDLDNRYNRLYLDINDISEGIVEQLLIAGKPFFKNGQEATTYEVVSDYYSRTLSWFQSIETLVKKSELDEKTSWYYLFYVEIGLISNLLKVHKREMEKQRSDEVLAKFKLLNLHFDSAIKSFDKEAQGVYERVFDTKNEEELKIKANQLIARLVDDYLEIIQDALLRYGTLSEL